MIGRLPVGALPLATLLAVHDRSGSFVDAGALIAAFGVGSAALGPVHGRLLDRLGHRRVAPAAAAVHVASIAGLAGGMSFGVALAVLAGAALPQCSGLMRAAWLRQLHEPDDQALVLGVEAVVVEIAFLVGPGAVSLALLAVTPMAAMLVFAGLAATGSVVLALSTPLVGRVNSSAAVGPLRSPGLRTLMAATIAFGVADGTVQVAVAAATTERLAGLLLSVVGVGTVGGGVLYLHLASRDPTRDFTWAHLAMAVALAGTSFLAASTLTLAFALLVLGLAAAPIGITNSRLLARVTDTRYATEAYNWLIVAVATGGALGSGTGGWIIERLDVAAALVVASVAAALGGAVVGARRSSLQG